MYRRHDTLTMMAFRSATMLRLLLPLCLLALLVPSASRAAERVEVFRAETIVTGTGEAERQRGFAATLEEVLVKASGEAGMADAAALSALLDRAADLVLAFEYEDRKKGRQISDEQGTRDRSHFLRVAFDPHKVTAALEGLGLRPWTVERPRLMVWLGVEDSRGRFLLARAGDRGYGQREALLSIARRRGVPVALPTLDSEEGTLSFVDTAPERHSRLEAAARRYGADGLLIGRLIMDAEGRWTVEWRLDCQNLRRDWRAEGVSFDAAMRIGIEGAAGALARAMP
jgi:hypothetical protein